jgi:hypothetical protein
MASLLANSISPLSAGLRSGATFAAALGVAGLLAQFTHAPPIFLAVIASPLAAGMAFALAVQDPFDADYTSLSQAGAHVASCLTALLGLWGIVNIVPAVGIFVCEPLVSWQFSIAIFGAFGMSRLSAATRLRIPHDRAGLMIHLAFFWIALFYGFSMRHGSSRRRNRCSPTIASPFFNTIGQKQNSRLSPGLPRRSRRRWSW